MTSKKDVRTVPCPRCGSPIGQFCYRLDGTPRLTNHQERAFAYRQPALPPVDPYKEAHREIRKARGPAKIHMCVTCRRPANEWAYLHTLPDPFIRWGGRSRDETKLVPFSNDPNRYIPLCWACHVEYDSR